MNSNSTELKEGPTTNPPLGFLFFIHVIGTVWHAIRITTPFYPSVNVSGEL